VLPTRALSRIERLPPPPVEPVRSPAVAVTGEVEVRVPGRSGGPSLVARIHAPPGAERAVVICHPHPLYGGSMHSPVPLALAKVLSDEVRGRVAWARFDFRGVGGSDGTYDDGRGEVDDALAVIDELRRAVPDAPLSVCGHSFGSWVGLLAATDPTSGALGPAPDRVLLLAPSVRFESREGRPLRRPPRATVFVGDRDEFCDVDEARALADELGADLRVFEGFDHHFLKSRRAMAEAALPVIVPEVVSP
jgi:alpha/beta superfamily hydrolase